MIILDIIGVIVISCLFIIAMMTSYGIVLDDTDDQNK